MPKRKDAEEDRQEHDFVARGIARGLSHREIAEEHNKLPGRRWSRDTVSYIIKRHPDLLQEEPLEPRPIVVDEYSGRLRRLKENPPSGWVSPLRGRELPPETKAKISATKKRRRERQDREKR